MSINKQIKIGALISYVAIFINIGAMLIYTPWMKNQIGLENYGLYTLANSFVSMFLMDFGIGASVSRFLSKYCAEGDLEAANNLVGMVYKLFIVIDAIVFSALLVLFFFIELIYQGLTPAELEKFKILYVIISAFSIFSFPFTTLNGIFNAYERFVLIKLCDLGQKLLSIGFIVLVLLSGHGVVGLVVAHAASGIISIIVKLILLKATTPIKPNFKVKDKALVKEILGFSIWITVLGIAQRLTYNIAPSILGMVSSSVEIAVYSPASAIAGYFYIFATAINGLFLPTVSRKIVQKKEEDILPLMVGVGRFQVVVLGFLYVGFATVGREFMVLWMGEEFLVSYYCVLLLAFPTIFEYSQQIANTTILAQNKVKFHAIVVLVTSLINMVISPILSYSWGAIGVSVGIVITAFINFVCLNILYYKVLKINVFTFYRRCYLPIAIPILGGISLSLLLSRFIGIDGWFGIIVKGIGASIVFFLLIFVFYVSSKERKAILSYIRGKFFKGVSK